MSSLDKVYENIPLSDRICEGCGSEIQRNVAMLNGKLYHWGCLKKTKACPTHRCLDCWSFLTNSGMTKVGFGDETLRGCGNCGSTHLRKVDKWYREKYLQ